MSKSKFWALELRDMTLPSPFFGRVLLGNFSLVLLYQIGTNETRALINVPESLAAAKSANGGGLINWPRTLEPSILSSAAAHETSHLDAFTASIVAPLPH